jgi:hypothetical protein
MYCSDCHGNNETTSASVAAGPHGSTNAYLLRFGNATWSTTAPTLNQTAGFCFNCHDPSRIRDANKAHSVGYHQQVSCQTCHVAVPHGLFRPALIALTKDGPPYNLGAAKVVRFQYASSPSSYVDASCYSNISPCHTKHGDPAFAPTTNVNTYY